MVILSNVRTYNNRKIENYDDGDSDDSKIEYDNIIIIDLAQSSATLCYLSANAAVAYK